MGIQAIGDIVNEISFKRNNNDNVGRRKTQAEIERADRLADYACEKIGSRGAREFYCKAAYELSDAIFIDCVETAVSKGRNPTKYLSWLLSYQLRSKNSRS